ncbi:MAG TPA: sigma-54 dependent transcriptional regulator [Gemmataceae bacterium]
MTRILLIDDDVRFSRFLRGELEEHGYWVECLDCAEGGPDVLDTGDFDLVLLDNQLPGRTGLEFLGDLQQRGIRLPVILMTGHGSANTAIEAVKRGAYAYAIKPLDLRELLRELEPLIVKALAIDWRGEQVRMPGDSAADDDCGPKLLGNSGPMNKVYERIGRCVRSELPVLIRGETGTGKELVARAIRAHSARKDKPFVVINCAAFDEDRLDDELFGHEAGAFRGADKLRKGGFEHADGGTLFLDEIGNLPPRIQEKLLGALDNNEVFRRSGNEAIKVNVRLLAATRHDLEAALREGKFQRELFSRLNGMPIDLPPLKERGPEDLRLLVQHFLTKMAKSTNRPLPTLHPDAWVKLNGYSWPGNIWELQNVIGRAALLCRGPLITATDIEFDERPSSDGEIANSFRRAINAALQSVQTNLVSRLHDILNQELLLLTLTTCAGDQQRAERLLGVPLSSLLPQDPGKPDAPDKNEKPKQRSPLRFQTEALLLIHNNPEWTVEEYAEKLGCSKATLYRYEAIKRALQARGGGR